MINIELVEGCKNIIEHTSMEPGDDVLLLMEYTKDPVIAETLGTLAKERGADVSVLWVKPSALGHRYEPSKIYGAAFAAADIVFGIQYFPVLYCEEPMRAMIDHGTTYIDIPASLGTIEGLSCEAARMPLEVMYKIFDWTRAKMTGGKEFRMTCKRGTDFTCKISTGTVTGSTTGKVLPGGFDVFYAGERCFYPELTGNGVIYFDGFYGTGYVPSGIPIKVTMKDGWATKIEGGPEAEWLDKFTAQFENGKHVCEVAIGENPKARINLRDATLIEAQRHAGVAHVALGDGSVFGGLIAPIHLDGTILEPSVWIDDELIIDNGVPLSVSDSMIGEAAKKYGDPNQILAYDRVIFW